MKYLILKDGEVITEHVFISFHDASEYVEGIIASGDKTGADYDIQEMPSNNLEAFLIDHGFTSYAHKADLWSHYRHSSVQVRVLSSISEFYVEFTVRERCVGAFIAEQVANEIMEEAKFAEKIRRELNELDDPFGIWTGVDD